MDGYRAGSAESPRKLAHVLRQHGAVFTALRGLEIHHPFAGFTNPYDLDHFVEQVLGVCARALVKNTRRTLRHLAIDAAVRFSVEDFRACVFADLQFFKADLTPGVYPVMRTDRVLLQERHQLLSRIVREKCPKLAQLYLKRPMFPGDDGDDDDCVVWLGREFDA